MTALHSDTLLDKKDVAEKFGVCTATIMNWVRNNVNFPKPVKISNKSIRFRESEIQIFLQEIQ